MGTLPTKGRSSIAELTGFTMGSKALNAIKKEVQVSKRISFPRYWSKRMNRLWVMAHLDPHTGRRSIPHFPWKQAVFHTPSRLEATGRNWWSQSSLQESCHLV